MEHLADDDAVLVIDETGFLKQGKASCGVARQYTGSAGKITNCQIGVFAAYVSRHGHAFIDRALYLPKGWTDDPARLKAASCARATWPLRPSLSWQPAMIERAIAAGVPFAWVAADSVYGVGDIERDAAPGRQGLCAGRQCLPCHFGPGASRMRLPAPPRRSPKRWEHPTGSACRPGREPKDRGCMTGATCELADLDAAEYQRAQTRPVDTRLADPPQHRDGDLAYFSTWCPAGTPIETLVNVEGHRWAIEDSFETAKNEFGLDHNETRSWHGWHRHVSLVMLAFAMMAAIQHQANKPYPKKHAAPFHPLVDPGDPTYSSAPRAKTHPSRLRHRMVALAACTSGRRTKVSPLSKNHTVMLSGHKNRAAPTMPAQPKD